MTYTTKPHSSLQIVHRPLVGEVIAVLGASGALGQALVPLLAKRGATLILCGRRQVVLSSLAADTGAHVVAGDLTVAGCRQQIYEVADRLGRLDAIAALTGEASFGAFAATSDREVLAAIQANLAIPMLAVKSLLPLMIRRRRGRICLVSSVWARLPAAGEVAYSAAKAGLTGFGLALASELAPDNIQVNVLAPAAFPSPMLARLSTEELQDLAARQGGRLLSTKRVAHRVLSLLDPDLDMSGRVLRIGRIRRSSD